MSLIVNLRHLASHSLRLEGELSLAELDLETNDEMIHASGPVAHDLEVQLLAESVLVRGLLRVKLDCHCVRCLKAFTRELSLGDWTCLLPLKGEESVPIHSDCVDLTPWIREDILLAFPQHPVCDAKCSGLADTVSDQSKSDRRSATQPGSSAWSELDKLKL